MTTEIAKTDVKDDDDSSLNDLTLDDVLVNLQD